MAYVEQVRKDNTTYEITPLSTAPRYNASNTYDVGDYCYYDGVLYRCKTAITTAEAWTASHWDATTVNEELKGIYDGIDDIVIISEQQPSVETNKIWIEDNDDYIEIPTMDDLDELSEDITELSGSIAPVETSTTATAAHAVGELFMVGETLMVALSAIAIGDTITTEGGSPNAAVTKLSDKLIKDVQINGSSILNNGVANIPYPVWPNPGVVKVSGDYGVSINSVGTLTIARASDAQVKEGLNSYRTINPINQHLATFYGLAKAAADTTQSASSNAVGTYTDAAKVAIQKMLGIYEAPWELIADVTSSEDLTQFRVNTDINGDSFALKRGIVIAEVPKTTTGARDNLAAQGRCVNPNDLEFHSGFPYARWVGATSPSVFYYEFDCDGVTPLYTRVVVFSQLGSTADYTQQNHFLDVNVAKYMKWFQLLQINGNSSLVPSGTRIRIYGQRYVQ